MLREISRVGRAATQEHNAAESDYEFFPHGADMGVRGVGRSKTEAFEQAARALTAVITDPTSVSPRDRVSVACDAPNDELLLVNWLNALIFEMATRRMLFSRFEVVIDQGLLHAEIWGEPIHEGKHELGVEVKGATCTELRVQERGDGSWIAQCVVDV